ncbi:DUF3991 domain-containing protein (plasmid) [Mesorhizobium sp. AR07]|nr:DUF3991 domain-containing protein [Mesorhizobium sp. AR07]
MTPNSFVPSIEIVHSIAITIYATKEMVMAQSALTNRGRVSPQRSYRSPLRTAIRNNRLLGSMWAAHTDDAGLVTGWEERGPERRDFATGGAKVLSPLGPRDSVPAQPSDRKSRSLPSAN